MKIRILLLSGFVVLQTCILFAQWEQTGGPNSQWIQCMITSGSNLFAGTNDGVFLSTDEGSSWKVINTGLTDKKINSLAVCTDKNNISNLFAATDSRVFRSTNEGNTWENTSKGLPNEYVSSLAVSGRRLFAGTYRGVYLSTNIGRFWTKVNVHSPNISTYVTASETNIVAKVTSSEFVSTDSGKSWIDAKIWRGKSGQVESSGVLLQFLVTSDTTFFGGGDAGIFVSTDKGANWEAANTGLPKIHENSIFADPVFSLIAYDKYLFTTNNNGVFTSTNNGKSWIPVNNGLTNTLAFPLAIKDSTIFVGIERRGIWHRSLSQIIHSAK